MEVFPLLFDFVQSKFLGANSIRRRSNFTPEFIFFLVSYTVCQLAKFSSTFSVSVAISVGLKFCFLAFLRGASAKTTISGEAISLSKQTKSIMGCYPRVSRV